MEAIILAAMVIALLFLLVGHDRNSHRLGSIAVNGQRIQNSLIIRPRSWVNKRVGLLNHAVLPKDFGLWLTGTSTVHTIGMLTPIDVVFIDKKNVVVEIIRSVKPGLKKVEAQQKSSGALELPVNGASAFGIFIGSILSLVPLALDSEAHT